MTAKELMKAGRLSEARSVLVQEVKAAPTDVGKRTLLFQVLALQGEWDKAARHLDLVSTQDPTRLVGVQTYLNIVKAEQERLKVIRGEETPSFLPDNPPYAKTYAAYLKALRLGAFDEARSLLLEIDGALPGVSGTVNGKAFEGMVDTDARLMPFLEAFAHDRYVLIPFEAIRELIIHEIRNSFDLIWVTASITTWEGLSLNASLPVIYPETSLHEDEQIQAGKVTDWVPLGGGLSKGAGQHVYQVGDEEMAMLEIREIQFTLTAEEGK